MRGNNKIWLVMAIIDKCPLCGKSTCIEFVRFSINGVNYSGIKCKETNSILYSQREDFAKEIESIKDLINRMEIVGV